MHDNVDVLVLAGSYEEYKAFACRSPIPNEKMAYMSTPHTLRGKKVKRVVQCGTFAHRGDADELYQAAMTRKQPSN